MMPRGALSQRGKHISKAAEGERSHEKKGGVENAER